MSCVVVRVCSEQNVSRKNAKIFVCISQTFSQKFMKRKCKTKQNFAKKNRETLVVVYEIILYKHYILYSRKALYFIFA